MTLALILILAAGICGVASIIDREHPWAGIGVLVLAVSQVVRMRR